MVGRGDLVYLPCLEEAAFLKATIVSDDRRSDGVDIQVEAADGSPGEIMHVPRSELRQRFVRGDGATNQDNTSLVHMNDATILENLRLRHDKDEIYTYTASVLLAMNPYKDIQGLYGEDQCMRYRGKHIGALPPHPYAIADTAYRALVRENKNQGLLISGESGAGKTETAKIVMQFLAFASGGSHTTADSIQARVLRASPILESFGNAATMRNSNSSRFGKYKRVFFDKQGALADADIITYLLETSRVVVHGERERTYHCFYEMLGGIDDAKLEAFGLERGRHYRLLCGGSGEFLPGFETRDRVNYARLCDALKTVGIHDEDLESILRVLAGLIHLGDIEKDDGSYKTEADDENTPVEVDEESAEHAARLLGVDVDELRARLTRKKVAVPGRTSFHEVPRSRSQFRHAVQSFIKAIYKRLFERLVQRINDSFRELRPAGAAGDRSNEDSIHHIGILDIYGFERLQRNSFEQLCINLANERLQQYFVENVLRAEQELYAREGLPWVGLPLPDATPVFNAIGQVFKTLDEYSQNLTRNVGNATDRNFCQKVVDEAAKDPGRRDVLRQLKLQGGKRKSVPAGPGPAVNEGFMIKHYAGQVEYNTQGWLDKNNDRLLVECETLICESEDKFVQSLGEEDQGKGSTLFRSISKKYSRDLESLLETLSTCNLHYIRCFKPNGEQKADCFQGQLVLDQIVQCGTIELVKIMHDGYPNRCPFEEITTRFKDLLPEDFQRYGMRTFIEALMLAYDVPKEAWALGMSRLFLKAGQLRALESMRSEGARPPAEKLAEIAKGIIRKRWVRVGHAVRLCNYLPRYLEQIHLRRAAKVLWIAALCKARLAPRAAAARQRVRERHMARHRRLNAVFHTVRVLQARWLAMRAARRGRLATALRVATLLHFRLRPWVAAARGRAAEGEQRREVELLRREEERKRLEEERLEEERARLEVERQRLEEELQRQEEEQRLREEEQRQREEELQRQLGRQREEMRQREEAERKALEEERGKIEEERRLLEEERRKSSILAMASPQHMKKEAAAVGIRYSAAASTVAAQASTDVGDDDDMQLGDSVSNLGTSVDANLQQDRTVKEQMEEHVQRLEAEMARKHEEIKAQMALLQQRNASLEQQLAEERKHKHENRSEFSGSEQSPMRRNMSPIPLDGPASPQTPCSSGHKSRSRQSASRSGQRISLLSIEHTDSAHQHSTASKGARRSAAHEALLRQDNADRKYSLGDAAPGSSTADLGSQRKWWAEQRQFLLEDLYGSSPPAAGRGPMANGVSRQPTRQVRNNLSTMFESAEDMPSGRGAGGQARSAETKMRKPTEFNWSKRHSLTGAPGSRE